MGWSDEDLALAYVRNPDLRSQRGFPESLERADWPGVAKLARHHKYGAKSKIVNGIVFASCAEARAYIQLRALESAGEITGLELQPRFTLQDGFRDEQRKWHRAIRYIADFRFWRCAVPETNSPGMIVVVDVKGFATPAFKIKEKLFRSAFPAIRLEIWK